MGKNNDNEEAKVAAPRPFWHTTPLHYVPHLLMTGTLFSQDRLNAQGLPILPRPTAARRDRKLKVSDYVHLSLEPKTPLLIHKRGRGYPHVLLEFDSALADLPGAAFLAYNTKAWRHREDFAPITGPEAKTAFLNARRGGRRYPSAELLIAGELPLSPHGLALHTASEAETEWLWGMIAAFNLSAPLPIRFTADLFPPGPDADLTPFHRYLWESEAAGRLLPPPDLPFD